MHFQIGGRRHGDDRRRRDLARRQRRIRELAVVYGEIDALLDQIDGPVGHDRLDADIRVAGEKLLQVRHDIEPANHADQP